MKYLKTQNLSKYSPNDKTLIVQYPTNQVNIESKSSIKLPTGDQIFRPYYPAEGMIRYNVDPNSGHEISDTAVYWDPTRPVGFEMYYEGQWYPIRTQGPARVRKENLGVGTWDLISQPNEDISKWFPISGNPLPYVPGLEQGLDPADYVDNMIVIVENVFQVSGTNFTLEESDGIVVGVEVLTGGTGLTPNSTTIPVVFSAPNVAGTTTTGLGTTDGAGVITEINITNPGSGYTGATTPTVTVTGATGGSYSVKIAKPGWHIKFLSAVPDTKPVIVYFGYDQ